MDVDFKHLSKHVLSKDVDLLDILQCVHALKKLQIFRNSGSYRHNHPSIIVQPKIKNIYYRTKNRVYVLLSTPALPLVKE